MVKIFGLMLISIAFTLQARPNILELKDAERCVYIAKLGAAASWIRLQKFADSCDTIKYIWDGEETEKEVDFVKHYTCEGFMLGLDPIKTGDAMFAKCMRESRI